MQHDEPTVISAVGMRGRQVRNPEGEGLGAIDDLAVDLDTARVAYVVVSVGGFLGIGDHLIAVPLQAFTLDVDTLELILDADRNILENAPHLEEPDAGPISDRAWRDRVYAHFGMTDDWQT
jgi:sporulation protein YlmC with PRC-barrel domain